MPGHVNEQGNTGMDHPQDVSQRLHPLSIWSLFSGVAMHTMKGYFAARACGDDPVDLSTLHW